MKNEKPKHTPGPWILDEEQYRSGIHFKGTLIAVIAGRAFDRHEVAFVASPDQDCNARLIAAAPEMLEALKSCLPLLDMWYQQRADHLAPIETSCVGQAHAAIAKAEAKKS